MDGWSGLLKTFSPMFSHPMLGLLEQVGFFVGVVQDKGQLDVFDRCVCFLFFWDISA